MNALLINSAAEPATITVVQDGNISGETQVADRKTLAETLLVRVDELLRQAAVPLGELQVIGVVTGPGPFTALRIGIATANALAFSERLPLVGVALEQAPDVGAFAKAVTARFEQGDTQPQLLPHYGKEPTITPPKPPGPKA